MNQALNLAGVSSLGQYGNLSTNLITVVVTLFLVGSAAGFVWYFNRRRPSGGHATVRLYIGVAAILAIVTAIEITIPYISQSLEARRWIYLSVMYLLAITKFAFVVMFFMHLLFDRWLCTFLFGVGMFLICGTLFALLAIIPGGPVKEPEPYTPPQKHGRAPGEALPVALRPPSAARGAKVFRQAGCTHCHAVEGMPGAVGTMGPALDGLALRAGSTVEGQDAQAYIRQSLVDPLAHVPRGYMKLMPGSWDEKLGPQQFEDRVAFLLSLGEGSASAR